MAQVIKTSELKDFIKNYEDMFKHMHSEYMTVEGLKEWIEDNQQEVGF